METKKSKAESIKQFKLFIKDHPKMKDDVRRGEKTWQEFFEEWYLLGESDSSWNRYRNEPIIEKSSGDGKKDTNFIKSFFSKEGKTGEEGNILETITGYVKKVDPDQIDTQITNIRSAIDNIQKIVAIFSPGSGNATSSSGSERKEQKQNHFKFRKD